MNNNKSNEICITDLYRHICICVYVYMCIQLYIYAYVYVCMYIYIYVGVCVCAGMSETNQSYVEPMVRYCSCSLMRRRTLPVACAAQASEMSHAKW